MRKTIDRIQKASIFEEISSLDFSSKEKPLIHSKVVLKNTLADISTIKSSYLELFFEYFPYQSQELIVEDFLPPRFFFNKIKAPEYLLTQNSQKEAKAYCPYMNYIKNLSFFGTLKQKEDKSVYLDIEDDFFIKMILNTVLDSSITKTDKFHINIISKDEYEQKEVFEISEHDLGQKCKFKIKDLYFTYVNEGGHTNKIWFLDIESEDLEEFRYKYHLFPKINGYNFSMILGYAKHFKLKKSYPPMKINISFIAA